MFQRPGKQIGGFGTSDNTIPRQTLLLLNFWGHTESGDCLSYRFPKLIGASVAPFATGTPHTNAQMAPMLRVGPGTFAAEI